jgi:hypothetical protein
MEMIGGFPFFRDVKNQNGLYGKNGDRIGRFKSSVLLVTFSPFTPLRPTLPFLHDSSAAPEAARPTDRAHRSGAAGTR